MTSHNPGRSQLVAVPSSKILERASASERVFWSSISDAVQSNTEDRTEIRTLIRNIRESFSKITEDGHSAEEVQRAHDIVVEDLRSTIVELLSCSYKSSSVVPTPRSSSIHELTTNQKHHSSRQSQSHMSEAVLQGARDIIGLRRVQLERELHEFSTREAQLLHRQEHEYSGAGEHSKGVVVPGFPGPKGRQEYPGAKSFDGPPCIDGDQVLQRPDRVPGNLVPTGDDGLQGVRGDVEPKGFPEPTGRDSRKGIPEEQGNTSSQRFPDGEGCRGLDGADKVPDTGFSKRHVPPGFDGRQGDTEFSKSDGPPGFNGQQGDTEFLKSDGPPGFNGQQGDTGFSRSDGPPGFDGLQGDPGLLGIPGSQGCTRVQGRSDFQGDTCEQDFPGPDAATGETGSPGVPVVRESDGEDGRSGRTGETGEKECQGPAGEQGFRVNSETVGSDGAPGVPGCGGLRGDVGHTGPHGVIGLDGDLCSTRSLGPNGLAVGIESQGSPGATRTRCRQGPEGPTRRIGLPDRVGDEGKSGLCGAPQGSGLVGPYGLNGWADGRRRNGPIRAQRFLGKKGFCSITSCVGLRGIGRQCDTRARGLPGANSHRDLTGLPGPTDDVYALRRWRQVQFDPGIFRSRWRSDYLLTLEPQWQLKY